MGIEFFKKLWQRFVAWVNEADFYDRKSDMEKENMKAFKEKKVCVLWQYAKASRSSSRL